jgi:DNA-binding beta-propeller fold protein YncE
MISIRPALFVTVVMALAVGCASKTPTNQAVTQTKGLPSLVADSPIALEGAPGKFDFMEFDPATNRILAAHPGTASLTLIDLNKPASAPKSATVADIQGVAVDPKTKTYILGADGGKAIYFLDSETLKSKGSIKVTGPVDAIAFDPKNGFAYADEDDGSHVWVVNVKTRKLVKTIKISGVPEVIVYDPVSDRLYQNLKTKDAIAVIDPAKNKVIAEWSTLPATGPHGLAIDSQRGRLYSAGHNGKLVSIDIKTGAVNGQIDIAPSPDQIAYDPKAQIVYSASKGFISAVRATDGGFEGLSETPSHSGSHTLAVDLGTGSIWVSYSDDKASFVQKFSPTPGAVR